VRVNLHREINLFEILPARGEVAVALGWPVIPVHRGKNNENSDDDEQFDQRKGGAGGRPTMELAWLLHKYFIAQNTTRLQWRIGETVQSAVFVPGSATAATASFS
jgi:hypothetical protein